MKTRMGLALAVMMAMTLGHVKAGRIKLMRSLVQPIPIQQTSYRESPQYHRQTPLCCPRQHNKIN